MTSNSAVAAPVSRSIGSFDRATFEAFLTTRNEPGWVTDQRRKAFEIFESKRSEDLDPEEWKRVEMRAFKASQFAVKPALTTDSTFTTLLENTATFGGSVVMVDGACKTSKLNQELASKGVLYGDLADLVREHRDVIEPHLMTRGVQAGQDRFAAWHAAFWTGGTVLYVPRNLAIEEPLYSLIGLAQEGAADLSHTLIILEEGASATVLEETASLSTTTPGLHIGAIELLVGNRAHLRFVQLQNWNDQTWHFAHQCGRVASNGSLQWTVGGLGSRLAHIHQDVHLDGRGANGEVNGVTFTTGKQILSYYTQQTHHAENTHSDLLYKDVLQDRSRVVWRGMIRVDHGAQKTDGYQRNDSLILTPTARVDAIPGLEIEADDVRCTHGATAGRVDAEQIFYAMSRGINRSEAMHMIVEGFFHSVYDRIPVEVVRETLSRAVEQKLGLGRAT